ncbi:MAG: hypothetical protein C5B51_27915 [Terriglobia bacterium]|nr:MAG: hypothetical protein C5B51_27915 [Terriglobia bacterium]
MPGFVLSIMAASHLWGQPGEAANRWALAADMLVPRADACSVALPDGRVLVIGGTGLAGALDTVEWSHSDGTFTMAAPLLEPRSGAACVALPDSRVLVTGGSSGTTLLRSAEIFDPEKGNWTFAGNMATGRARQRAVLTPWGSVLLTGGDSETNSDGHLEVYLPESGRFRSVVLSSQRTDYALVILPDQRFLVAGGTDGESTSAAIEIYDATTGAMTSAASMLEARRNFAATLLLDGRVLITGGNGVNGKALASTEIFDPASRRSVPGAPLAEPRAGHESYALPHNGNVLLLGGTNAQGVLGTSELYLPWGEKYPQSAPLNVARARETSAIAHPGALLVSGGTDRSGYLASNEIYRFATIDTDKQIYSPEDEISLGGSGWVPGEKVSIRVTEGSTVQFSGQTLADETGHIALRDFKLKQGRFGALMLLTAVGTQSLAQTPVNLTGSNVPTIIVTISPSPATSGQPLTVTVAASGGAGTPTGTVKLAVDGTTYGDFIPLTSGGVSFGIPSPAFHIPDPLTIGLVAGQHLLGVNYSGDANYTTQVFTVNQVALTVQQRPWVVSVIPSSGAGSAQTFAVTASDSAGPAAISTITFLLNTGLNGANGCWILYNRAANTLQLANDPATGFSAPITIGTLTAVSNSQCTLNAATASTSTTGNNLTVNIPLTFTVSFAGAKSSFVNAYDNGNQNSGWQFTGSWTIPTSPAIVSVVPSSGSGFSQIFGVTVSDSGGPSLIGSVVFLVNTGLNGANACWVLYNRAANTLQLANDAATGFSAPITVGTPTTASNSQCTVNAAAASTSTNGNNLTVNLPLIFTGAFVGAKATFALVNDTGTFSSGWVQTGSWTVTAPVPPSVVSAVPNSGSGSSQSFAVTVSDPSGPSAISTVSFLVSNGLNGANACWVLYNNSFNTLQLANDPASGFSAPITIGASSAVSNSQCTISAASAFVTTSGNTLTIHIPLSFAFSFAGGKGTFAYVIDPVQNSGWVQTGSWTVPASGAPTVLSILPSSGSGSAKTFAVAVADGGGATLINQVSVLFNTGINGANACWLLYNRAANTLALANDAASGFSAPIPIGAAAAVSNSQCTLSAASASVTTNGTVLMLNLPLSFTFSFAGGKGSFVIAYDSSQNSGWVQAGNWTVPASGPPAIVSVTPSSGSGSSQTFAATAADGGGPTVITYISVLFNTGLNGANACWVLYNRAANTLQLANDAATAFSAPITIGTSTSVSNSQCTVNALTASSSSTGNNLTVNIPLVFAGAFTGAKGTFAIAYDSTLNSGWQNTGGWTVP